MNYKKFILIFLIFSSPSGRTGGAFAQSQFQRCIGGTSGDDARSIIQTTDGGYAAAGSTGSFGAGNQDFYIVKLNGSGMPLWSKTFGGTANDFAESIIQTTDGGYAVAGSTGTAPSDICIVKLDASGTLQWSKTIGGTNDDYAHSIIQTTDGGYAVAGSTGSFGAGSYDMYIVKLDAGGTLQWSKTIGGTDIDLAYSIIQTTDGGYAVAGSTGIYPNYDMYIVKLNAGGTLQWSKTIGGTNDDYARSIIQTTDGGYAAAGVTSSFGAGGYDMYIVKLDAGGTLQWSKTIGGANNDRTYSIIQTTDGGYAAAGSTASFGAGGTDMYIVKFNATGVLQWSKTIGGTSGEDARSIIQTTDGGYAAAGSSISFAAGGSDMFIVKLDASGNTCGNSTSPTPTVTTPTPTVTTPTPTVTTQTPTVTAPTPTVSSGGTLTTVCLVGIQPISNEIPNSYQLYQNYPNPFNPATKISFSLPKAGNVSLVVYDILGREVTTLVNEFKTAGNHTIDFNVSSLASSVYFYTIKTGDFTDTKKMVLMK